MSLTTEIFETLENVQGIAYRMIVIKIVNDDERFPVLSNIEFMKVTDETSIVEPFDLYLTRDQKEFIGHFTTDGFSGFLGNVDISFGYGNKILGTISAVDINATGVIDPLPPLLSSQTYLDADNQWLSTL